MHVNVVHVNVNLSPNKVRVFKRLKSAYIFFFPLQSSLAYDTHFSKSVPALVLLNVLSLYKIWGKWWHFLEKAFKIQTSAYSSNVQRHLCNSLLHIPIKFRAIINSVNLSKKEEQKLPGNLDKNSPKKVWSGTITFLIDGTAYKTLQNHRKY